MIHCSPRRCVLLYSLSLLLNLSLYLLLYRDIVSLPSALPLHQEQPQQQQQQLPCACPSPAAQVGPEKTSSVPPKHHLAVILVLSSLKGRERRDTIRKTWMKGYQDKKQGLVVVKFALGTEGLSPAEMEDVKSEEVAHGDLLLLPNLIDSYTNLTRKVLTSFIALDASLNFSYLMKCDDDTFVVLDTILNELTQRKSKQSYYWGFFDGRAHVHRQGKWAEKKWFLCDRYLPYALGGGYVLSHDLVRRIVSNSDSLVFYNSEDVSVGVWLSPYDAERHHDVRFNTEFVSRGCRNSYIVSHKQSVNDMVAKQRLLEVKGVQCEKEYQTRLSYIYDWSTDPTKCCERVKGVP